MPDDLNGLDDLDDLELKEFDGVGLEPIYNDNEDDECGDACKL